MKKIYLLLLILFSFAEMKGQGCIINMAYDSTTTVFDFAVAPVSTTSVFNWDFGDSTGIYTTGNIATHSYANFGTYMVCVTEFDTVLQTIVDACCTNVFYNNTAGCSFTSSVASGLAINFAANATSASTITWDFGDGNVGTGIYSTHTYAFPGTYYVCMTASSFLGNCSYCQVVIVSPGLPCTISEVQDSINPATHIFTFNPIDPSNQIQWTFGDGGTAGNVTNVSHTYNAPAGVYTACAVEYDSTGTMVCQACIGIQVGQAANCSFTFSPLSLLTNTYLFTTSYDSTLYVPVWDFGDGISYTGGAMEQHSYATGGVYFVCMILVDIITQNIVCTTCLQVAVPTGPTTCTANFTTVPFGLDAYFIDYSSTDPAVTTYTWDFGDGSPLNTSRFPVHTYGIPGTYNVCLSILNSSCADTMCQTIVVDSTIIAPVFCTSYFVFTQLSPYQLAVVNLSSGTNLSFMWDFGDGSTSTAPYPIHNYASTGSYNICLTVADANGCTSTYCDSLSVDSTGMITYRSSTVGFTINVVSPTQLNTVSIDENISSLISSIYPNPAKDRIFVTSTPKSGATNYSILSISSQLVKAGSINAEKTEIDIADLSPGIYFLEVRNSGGEKSFARFIKN